MKLCLQSLDTRLIESSFLCGEDLTIADVVTFSDVSLYVSLMQIDIDGDVFSKMQNLFRWFKHKMLLEPKVAQANKEMQDALKKTTINKPK